METSPNMLGDTWTFRYEALVPAESCLGLDGDLDGLFGCADPDCFGHCAPLCPPQAPCNTASQRCGDGDCDAVESCRLCPLDCGPCQAICGDLRCDAPETAASCPGDCALCGDGARQAHEQCDDGNLQDGDGCSAGCLLEQ